MKKKIGKSLLLIFLLCGGSFLYLILRGTSYPYYLEPMKENPARIYSDYVNAYIEDASVAEIKEVSAKSHNIEIVLKGKRRGKSRLVIFFQYKEAGESEFITVKRLKDIRVDVFGRLIVGKDAFVGAEGVFFASAVFLGLLAVVKFTDCFLRWKRGIFSYKSIYQMGSAIFLFFVTYLFLQPCSLYLRERERFLSGMETIKRFWLAGLDEVTKGFSFLLLGFALLVTVSNLLSGFGTRRRKVNLAGCVSGLALLGLACLQVRGGFRDFLFAGKVYGEGFEALIQLLFLYFLSMGLSVVFFHSLMPFLGRNKNIGEIVLLGCGTTKEDKASEEMQRRLQAALSLYHKRPDSVFLLVGGKKKNRLLSESRVMEEYLLGQGVKKEQIRTFQAPGYTKDRLRLIRDESHCAKRKSRQKLFLVSDESQIVWEILQAKKMGIYMLPRASDSSLWKLPNAYIKVFCHLLWERKYKLFADMIFLLLCIYTVFYFL